MTNCWIITNRKVTSKDEVDETTHEALPVFRVCKYTPKSNSDTHTEKDPRQRVSFFPDVDIIPRYNSRDTSNLLGTERLFREVYNAMHSAPEAKGDTLVFLHGFNYSWQDSLNHLQRLAELYGERADSPIANIVYFSWPSRGSYLRYPADQKVALESGALLRRVFEKAGRFYRDFFGKAKAPFCGKRLHLAAHSMGNQVLEAFVGGLLYSTQHVPIFSEVLMLNADLDWNALNPGRPLNRLPELCDRVHIYSNKSDDAVLISEWTKNAEKRLGKHGPKDLQLLPARCVVVECSTSKSEPTQQCQRFDSTAQNILNAPAKVSLKERLIDHWGYLYREAVIRDIFAVMRGTPASKIPTRSFRHSTFYRLK